MTPNWERAECAGYSYRPNVNPDAFFPTAERHSDPEASAMCQRCPIIDDCLQWALRHEAWGYFGGTFPEQRQQMRRKLNILLEPVPSNLEPATPRRQPIPDCGTLAAAQRHKERHEPIDAQCRNALNEQRRRRIKRAERKKERENTA